MVLDAVEVPAIELSGTLSGVQAGPFLAAAIGVSRLDGTAAASLQASGRGNSERDIVATLAGSGRFQVENGAIHSGDLMASVLNAVGALLKGGAGASGETAFSRLSGSFTMRNGEMVTNDLALQSPLLSVAGRGTVSLPRRRLDYRLDATLLAAAKIEIAGVTLAQLTVPITVSGPWEDVQYRTDVGAALAGIGNKAVLQQLQTIIPDTGGLGRALTNAPAAANPAKLIPNLFGR
jgi:AsmA protein